MVLGYCGRKAGKRIDVADRLLAGEDHHEPVDPEPDATGRRHSVGERLDVVRVAALARHLLRLLVEPLLLRRGVVDLRKRVPELHPAGEVFEPLGQRRVVVGRSRERRQLDRVVVDDRRLDQPRLDEVREGMVDELRPVLVGVRVDTALRQPGAKLVGIARPELVALERVDESHARPRARQLDLVPAERHLGRAPHLPRDALDELLDPVHRVVVVGVRLVPLELRELRVVLEGDALVAKVLAELVDALEPSDDQSLQIQLGRDAEVQVRVQLVVMGHERAGERAPVPRLQDRRLDFDEPPLVERAADRRDDLRAREERLARLVVHQQVEVAPAVAQLDVGQPVERVGQRLRVAGQDVDARGQHGRLAASRFRGPTHDADDVSEMDVELTRDRDVADHLDASGTVDEIEEDKLAHSAPGHRATGEPTGRVRLAPCLERLRLRTDGGDLVPVGEALRRRHGAPAYWSGASTSSRDTTWIERTSPSARPTSTETTSPCVSREKRSGSRIKALIVDELPSSTAT